MWVFSLNGHPNDMYMKEVVIDTELISITSNLKFTFKSQIAASCMK